MKGMEEGREKRDSRGWDGEEIKVEGNGERKRIRKRERRRGYQ